MKHILTLSVLVASLCVLTVSQTKIIIGKNDGTSDSLSLSDIKGISFASNLVKNGDFNESKKYWTFIGEGENSYHPEDPGRADFTVADGVLSVNITNQGMWEYSIMVYQSVLFERGATYVVSFNAMADTSMDIVSNITQDVTWTNFSGDKTFHLTNVMASYSYQFTMPVAGAALFQFCLGNFGTRTIYIDNIDIRKK